MSGGIGSGVGNRVGTGAGGAATRHDSGRASQRRPEPAGSEHRKERATAEATVPLSEERNERGAAL